MSSYYCELCDEPKNRKTDDGYHEHPSDPSKGICEECYNKTHCLECEELLPERLWNAVDDYCDKCLEMNLQPVLK